MSLATHLATAVAVAVNANLDKAVVCDDFLPCCVATGFVLSVGVLTKRNE